MLDDRVHGWMVSQITRREMKDKSLASSLRAPRGYRALARFLLVFGVLAGNGRIPAMYTHAATHVHGHTPLVQYDDEEQQFLIFEQGECDSRSKLAL